VPYVELLKRPQPRALKEKTCAFSRMSAKKSIDRRSPFNLVREFLRVGLQAFASGSQDACHLASSHGQVKNFLKKKTLCFIFFNLNL
jgi:hypothetical protein